MIGIDEVGRGCWAGPLLVVAARETSELPLGLNDSKVLSKQKREKLYPLVKESCDLGEGWVTNSEIDKYGLSIALKLGARRALKSLNALPHEEIILDGNLNYCPPEFFNVKTEPRADAKYPIVSAASIFAKVRRDAYMTKMHEAFPDYLFHQHVGYGTALHLNALKQFGLCELHRKSFKPVQAFI